MSISQFPRIDAGRVALLYDKIGKELQSKHALGLISRKLVAECDGDIFSQHAAGIAYVVGIPQIRAILDPPLVTYVEDKIRIFLLNPPVQSAAVSKVYKRVDNALGLQKKRGLLDPILESAVEDILNAYFAAGIEQMINRKEVRAILSPKVLRDARSELDSFR